jgi:hypothetical protein
MEKTLSILDRAFAIFLIAILASLVILAVYAMVSQRPHQPEPAVPVNANRKGGTP